MVLLLQKRNRSATKRALSTVFAIKAISSARSQAEVTPLDVPDDERAFLLAVQRPQVVESGGWYSTVGFNTGPNAYPYNYNVKCYSVANVTDDPLTCAELASTGASAVGKVVAGRLPLKYAQVSVDVTGINEEIVDCYVTVSGPTGKNFKCSYAGRAVSPPFYLAENGVTVKCPFADLEESGIVNGITYTKRDEAALTALVNTADEAELATSCTSGVGDMTNLFVGQTDFNEDISSWDTSSVTIMAFMFAGASAFNQPIGSWDTRLVANMEFMFTEAAAFNQPIGDWDTSSVFTMNSMFLNAPAFNQPIDGWDLRSLYDMSFMFQGAVFNQPIGSWDTSSVALMGFMFYENEVFNQPIGSWNTSSVVDMGYMFNGASAFNQDLSDWDASSLVGCGLFADGATAWLEAYNGTIQSTPPLSQKMIDASCGP